MGILNDAIAIVNKDREEDYGDMTVSFRRIAGLWSSYLGVHIDSFDVAKMMMLLKISRSKEGNHRDSLVDIGGYLYCIEKILESQNG